MKVVIIAPGHSLTQAQCDAVRGAGAAVAVGDAYRLAPWCDAIAATDRAWWRERPDAKSIMCRRFAATKVEDIEHIQSEFVSTQSSSGVLGLVVAEQHFGMTRGLMIGFDNHGTHFFGPHTGKLKNTDPLRFKTFGHQFTHLRNHFKLAKIEVRNATPGTALEAFQKTTLDEGLVWLTSFK